MLPGDKITRGNKSLKFKAKPMWFTQVPPFMLNIKGIMLNQFSYLFEAVRSDLIWKKVIYNAIWKTLLYHRKDTEKSRVLLLEPTDMSAVNVLGNTIHSSVAIKPVQKLFGLNGKSKGYQN